MLRTMFYYGTIITSRLLTSLATLVVGKLGGYYMVWSCDELANAYIGFGLGNITEARYPQCFAPNATAHTMVPVAAVPDISSPAELGSAIYAPFGSMVSLERFLGIERTILTTH